MRYPLLPLVLAVFASACTDSPAGPDVPVPISSAMVVGQAPAHVAPARVTDMSQEELEMYFGTMNQLREDVNRAVMSPGSWETSDTAVRALLDDYPELPQYVVDQMAATLILEERLLKHDPSPAVQEAVGHYTRLLIASESPDAVLLERSLRALDGAWPPAEVQAAAADAAEASARFVGRRTDCDGCSVEDLLARVPTSDSPGAAAFSEATASSLRRLDAMAEGRTL